MDRIIIISIILIIMLFTGIAIMMDPTKLIGQASQSREQTPTASNNQNLRAVLAVGSVSTIVGLVGIGVIGFISSRKAHEN